jgi:pimeloyl-ACP methyl ester carboxylesterase
VHGIPKTMFAFRKVIPYLTPKYRVLAVDLRGFGDSERPASGYDCATMASDLIKVADEVGFEKFIVVGEDWGAAYAYTLAATHRDRVVGLVFQEMILPGLGFEDGIHLTGGTNDEKLKPWDTRTFWHLIFFSVPDYPEMLLAGRERQFWTQWMRSEMRDPSALTQEDIDEYAGWTALPGGLRTVCEVYRTTEQGAITNRQLMEKTLECPVLAVGGDFFFGEVPRRQMERIAMNVRGAVIHSGHNIALEKPKELAEAYISFFDEIL